MVSFRGFDFLLLARGRRVGFALSSTIRGLPGGLTNRWKSKVQEIRRTRSHAITLNPPPELGISRHLEFPRFALTIFLLLGTLSTGRSSLLLFSRSTKFRRAGIGHDSSWLAHKFGFSEFQYLLRSMGVCPEQKPLATEIPEAARQRRPRRSRRRRATATHSIRTLEEEIRRRAYELYEQRGCTPGRENEDWLVAEQEIVARHQQPGA